MRYIPQELSDLMFGDGFSPAMPANCRVRPTVLVFPFGLLSHYLRSIVFARSLKDKYDVLFLDHPEYGRYAADEGFGRFGCRTWDGGEVIRRISRFDFSWLDRVNTEPVLQGILTVCKKYMPYFIVGDAYPCLKIASEVLGIPLLSIVNGYMTPYYDGVRALSRRHPVYPIVRWLPPAWRRHLTRVGERGAFRKIQAEFNLLRDKYSLDRLGTYWEEMEGDYNLICDDEVLFPQKGLPANYQFIGPLLYDFDWTGVQVRTLLDPSKKTLYVNAGSSGNWNEMSFLLDDHYRKYNIVTAGDREGILKPVAAAGFPFLPASAILPATDLLICHGGNGIVNQAISYGVRMLIRTTFFDQEWNAAAVERAGLGRSLDGVRGRRRLQRIVDAWMESN
jgi:UDP:flavonoid glycosyltransferase YjiC (YdhE family)